MTPNPPIEYEEAAEIELTQSAAEWLVQRLNMKWQELVLTDIASCRKVHEVMLLCANSRGGANLADFAIDVFRKGLAIAAQKPSQLHTLLPEQAIMSFLTKGKDNRYRFRKAFDESLFKSGFLIGGFPVGESAWLDIDAETDILTWSAKSWTPGTARSHVMGKWLFESLRLLDWTGCPGGVVQQRAVDQDDRVVETTVLERYGHAALPSPVDDIPLVLPEISGFGDLAAPSSQSSICLDW